MNFKKYFFGPDQDRALKERKCLEDLVVRFVNAINKGDMDEADEFKRDIENSYREIKRMRNSKRNLEEMIQKYGRLTIARAISDYNE